MMSILSSAKNRFVFLFSILALAPVIQGCSDDVESVAVEEVIRGLKTHQVAKPQDSVTREYPSVLQPSSLTVLSFEVAGKLNPLTLAVGQTVSAGDLLAELDPTSLELEVETAQAALDQAQANAATTATTYRRRADLRKDGFVSQAEVDESLGSMNASKAQVQQAIKQLEAANNNLTKSVLVAPFDGIINNIEVDSYSTVSVGAPVVSMYGSSAFEASFSVSFNVAETLTVGKPAVITLADRPDIKLSAVITELGSRADTVSSFPVIVSLTQTHPILKAGMAIGASLDFNVTAGSGYELPLQALSLKPFPDENIKPGDPVDSSVFVFDPDSSTVEERPVVVAGVRENMVIVISGLEPGDLVASAGVSFLKDGQKVNLLDKPR